MSKITWVKYNDKHQGPRCKGTNGFCPQKPWDMWTKIMGVVARCEGKHDTTVMYDGTGVTWGFLQWTFTSGRLQKLLESFKSIPYYDFEHDDDDSINNLFDKICCDDEGPQSFRRFGFQITSGRFIKRPYGITLDPAKDKKGINDLCLGKDIYFTLKTIKAQRVFAKQLAQLFVDMGQYPEVAAAQIQFAKHEFERSLHIKRKPLGAYKTISALLPDEMWDTPIPAIFFNLWQNSPAGSYKMFINTWKQAVTKNIAYKNLIDGKCKLIGTPMEFLDLLWRRLNKTAYANWGWNSKRYKAGKGKPRIIRIKPAIKEYYNINLPYYK